MGDADQAPLRAEWCRTDVEGAAMRSDADRDGTPFAVVGTELRHYRTQAALSQADLAARAYVSHDVISKVETGERPPADGLPERLDAIPELDTREALARLWGQLRKSLTIRAYPGWFRPWAELEALATTLRWFELVVVPGLLQTEDYARAVLRTRVKATDEEVDEMVAARMERQAILARDDPPMLWVIIDEGVLRRPIGGSRVMRDQINHLIEMARRPNMVIQVIPAVTGAHEGLRGAGFIIADLKDAPAVAYQDAAVRGQVIEYTDDIASLMVMWDTLKAEALPRSASMKLMEEAAKTWT
jgi:transcriptional regulator with XRE-family HTH domain